MRMFVDTLKSENHAHDVNAAPHIVDFAGVFVDPYQFD